MNLLDIASKVVSSGANLLGTVLGGPVGGTVLPLVASLFGADPANPEDILKKIAGDPEADRKLKELEYTHKENLEKLQIDAARVELEDTRAHLQDRQDARNRQVKSEQVTGKKNVNLYALAWLIVGGFFGLCATLMFVEVPESSSTVANMLFGGLVTSFAGVVSYFFGSSKSSSDKTAIMANGG